MNTRLNFCALLLGTLAIASAPPAFGWGDEGHATVALIADHYLDPAVRAKVNAILAGDTSGLTPDTGIATEATWADKYRDSDRNTTKVRYNQTHNWHFVDIELDAPDLAAACFGNPSLQAGTPATQGSDKDCVVDKIDEFVAELKDPATGDEERRHALQFLLHFVGDLHQPLHASDDHDQGGNQKTVSGPGLPSTKLHSAWDTAFVEQQGSTDPASVASQLLSTITEAQRASWSAGTAADWAQESFALARDDAYGMLPAPTSANHYRVSSQYIDTARQVVGTQLSRAGVRLASLLNAALAGNPMPSGAGAGDANPPATTPPQRRDLLWFRTSAEMQAAYLQAYRVAGNRVPALAAGHAPGTWAVIMDADETILNNSEWELRGVIADPAHPKGSWNDWVREVRAAALPGAKAFIDGVHAAGGKVVVVTNREDSVCEPTRQNFAALQISVDGVLCATDTSRNKNPRFQSVIDGSSSLHLPPLVVVAYVGDNIQDFPGKLQASPGSLDDFGASLFILPNPVYGSWDQNILH